MDLPPTTASTSYLPSVAGHFLVIVLLALIWRLPYAATFPLTPTDETRYSLPTVEHLETGQFLTSIYGTDYGAPVHEWMAVLFRKLLGPTPLALRLPVVLLGSFAAGLAFLSLRTAISTQAAFFLALPLACPPSSPASFTIISLAAYAATMLLVAAIQLATFWLDAKRSPQRWAVLGLIMGTAFYVLKLSVLQSAISLAWLFFRSEAGRSMVSRMVSTPAARQRLRRAFIFAVTSLLAFAPLIYRALTRRGGYSPGTLELIAGASAVVFGFATLLCLWPALRLRIRDCSAAAAFLIGFLPVPLLTAWHFAAIEKPRLAAAGVPIYPEAVYALKHIHDWPSQALLFVERVFPALLLGRHGELEGIPTHEIHPGWKTALMVSLFALLAFSGARRWLRQPTSSILLAPDVVIIAPFFLVVAIMLPSWSLHGDFCYRYLLPFVPGFLLVAFRCLEPALLRWRKTSLAVLAIYLGYSALDCSTQLYWPPLPAEATQTR
jgi:hypothetical protein